MLIYLLLIGAALSAPAEDVDSLIYAAGFDSIAELTLNDETFLMYIVPSGKISKKILGNPEDTLADIVDGEKEEYQTFMKYFENGQTSKGLTFNIYDDKMREAAVALYSLIKNLDPEHVMKVKFWAARNINENMFDYAERLYWLHGLYFNDFGNIAKEPPFVTKPHFFTNAETIHKALKINSNMNKFNSQDSKIKSYFRIDDLISINTNYSGWNMPSDNCNERIDYFTEDISLNSYYYGIQLLHPFWMSNYMLNSVNPKHAEQYYFRHQQLFARFELENENMKQRNTTRHEMCVDNFNPYIIYDNGLPFPIRSNIQGDRTDERVKLDGANIVIKECLSRGITVTENGTIINLNEDNHIDAIAKFIRSNYDGPKTAKIVRSLYGYGHNGYPVDRYNPAPSLLHQPETTLRDPGFWFLIPAVLKYFSDYQKTLEPFDISQYETDKFVIRENNFTKLTTYFEYYQFVIDKALQKENDKPISFTARQKRLNFIPFSLNFTVISKINTDVIVRLFLGPACREEDCWNNYKKFWLIDYYVEHLNTGQNKISWNPDYSNRFSSDEVFNKEYNSHDAELSKYNMFKYPKNLLLPKGLQEGLNLTLFCIITPTDNSQINDIPVGGTNYDFLSFEIENQTIGFPFHRQSKFYKSSASNYRFFNISVFHKKRPIDRSGYFSLHLY